MPDSAQIHVEGNVAGSIVVGDNNLVVNTNYGSIIYKQAAPRAALRNFAPQPPRPPRGFLNRSAELEQLQTWLAANEIILLHAADGLGKTSLLRQAANSPAARAFPQGVIFLESCGADAPALGEDLIQQIFDALFESEPPLKVTALSARAYLSNTRPLIVLDEVPLTPAAQRALPDLFPNGAILLSADVSSGGEYQRLGLGPLPRAEAMRLLAAQAGLTDQTGLDDLCAALNDIPLALQLTGNLLRETGQTPQQMLAALRQTASEEKNPTQAALERVYLLAWQILTEPERQLLSAAALTPGVSNAPAWFQAALGGSLEPALERLQSLGLLYANSPRLRLPVGLRLPAQRLARLQEDDLLPRLAAYLLQGARDGLSFLQAEQGNFWGVAAWALRQKRFNLALSLARAINPLLVLRGQWEAWQAALQTALEAARQLGDLSAQAWALHEMGTRLLALGSLAQAASLLRQALRLRVELGETAAAAYTRHNLNLLVPPAAPPRPAHKIPWAGLAAGAIVLAALILTGILLFSRFAPRRALPPSGQAAPSLTAAPPSPSPAPSATPPPSATDFPTPDVQAPSLTALQISPDPSFYGDGAQNCSLAAQVTLSFVAQDASALTRLELRYRYQSGELLGEWQNLALQENLSGQYSVSISHNENQQALRALDGLDGELVWQVWAQDAAGNASALDGPAAQVRYSRCEATPPLVSEADYAPSPANYGDVISCDSGLYYPTQTQTQVYVTVTDESALTQVYVTYFYRLGAKNGPTLTADLFSPNHDSYFVVMIDHNLNSQAQKALKGKNGTLVGQIFALDEFGNQTAGAVFTIPVEYHFCPPPG